MNKVQRKSATPQRNRKLSCQSVSTDDDCCSDSSQTLQLSPTLLKSSNIKYKTELCRNYSEMGYCPYYEKCQFAHGYEELEVAPPGYSTLDYRNRRCIKFWTTGQCSYGLRCKFSHYEVNRATLNNLRIFSSVVRNSEEDQPIVSAGSRLLRGLYPTYENLYSLEETDSE